MSCINHRLIGLSAFGRKPGEDRVEYAKTAPSDEALVDRLVRTILFRCIAPAQPVADDEDDAAGDPPLVNPRDPVRERKAWRDATQLRW